MQVPSYAEDFGILCWDLLEIVCILGMLVLDLIFYVNWKQDYDETNFATVDNFTVKITYCAHLAFLVKQVQTFLVFVSIMKFFAGLRAVPQIRRMWLMLRTAGQELLW